MLIFLVSLSSLIKEAIALDNPLGAAIAPYVQKRSKIPDSLLLPLLKERLSNRLVKVFLVINQ